MKNYLNWKSYWDEKSKYGPLVSTGRSGSSISDLHSYIDSTINSLGGLNKKDTILDAGGGAGYIGMLLSSKVKKIYLCDYSKKMIQKAKKNVAPYKNIEAYVDNIVHLNNTRKKNIKFSKSIVGSVLQYLRNYSEIEKTFKNFFIISKKNARIIFTHNPDLKRKSQFIRSYNKLHWNRKKIQASIKFENRHRFWLDYQKLKKLALSIGYSKCEKCKIDSKLFQSTHMFDFLLIK
tara:strand:- start:362 stop:1063 length:702 start_codon:yes stop_codon:yes gene_type:complete